MGCLINASVTIFNHTVFDHRYFYVDENNIRHSTCGLARETMARLLHDWGDNIFLDKPWLLSMQNFCINPSTLSFIVENACLPSISLKGLKVEGLGFNNMKTIAFQGV